MVRDLIKHQFQEQRFVIKGKGTVIGAVRGRRLITASYSIIPKKGSIMEEFKLYRISDEYVEWLREDFLNVYSNKVNTRS